MIKCETKNDDYALLASLTSIKKRYTLPYKTAREVASEVSGRIGFSKDGNQFLIEVVTSPIVHDLMIYGSHFKDFEEFPDSTEDGLEQDIPTMELQVIEFEDFSKWMNDDNILFLGMSRVYNPRFWVKQ